jgi:hypothetical protein
VKAQNVTFCLACNDIGSGCDIVSARVSGRRDVSVAFDPLGYGSVTVGPFANGDSPTVMLWAYDHAGNVGIPVVVTWVIDLNFPQTFWSNVPVVWSGLSSLDLLWHCSQSDCSLHYSLDNTTFGTAVPVTNASVTAGVDAFTSTTVDTLAVIEPADVWSEMLRFEFRALVNGTSRIPDWSTVFVEASFDGDSVWTDVRNFVGYDSQTNIWTVGNGFSRGFHSLVARSKIVLDGAIAFVDHTPYGYAWFAGNDHAGNAIVVIQEPVNVVTPSDVPIVIAWESQFPNIAQFVVSYSAVHLQSGVVTDHEEHIATTVPMFQLDDVAPGCVYNVSVQPVLDSKLVVKTCIPLSSLTPTQPSAMKFGWIMIRGLHIVMLCITSATCSHRLTMSCTSAAMAFQRAKICLQ